MNVSLSVSVLAVRGVMTGACQAAGSPSGEGAAAAVTSFLGDRLLDQSQRLTTALQRANERAWQAVELVLAGTSWGECGLARLSAADKAAALDELRRAQKAGVLQLDSLTPDRLVRSAAGFARFSDPQQLIRAEMKVIVHLAGQLSAGGYPTLARALTPPPGEAALLAVAVQYFFRRAVEDDEPLARGLAFAQWEPLPQEQEARFADHAGRLEQLLQEVATPVDDSAATAAAHANAYHAALETRAFDKALAELRAAVALAPAAYAPFPFDKYSPARILGAGGFGVAFLCKHVALNAPVVVKTFRGDAVPDMDRLIAEAQVLQRLEHPAIIGLQDCDFSDPKSRQKPYLVTDYFPGKTLQDLIEAEGPLAVADFLPLGLALLRGLGAAHKQKILHRDIKPTNLLVRRGQDGGWEVKWIDFGLAIARQVKTPISGTMEYAAPEQMGQLPGVPVSVKSDLFGCGKTMCFALFGTTQPLPRDWQTIPGELSDVIGQCLDESPELRPANCEAVIRVLEALATKPAPARAAHSAEKVEKAQKSSRGSKAVALVMDDDEAPLKRNRSARARDEEEEDVPLKRNRPARPRRDDDSKGSFLPVLLGSRFFIRLIFAALGVLITVTITLVTTCAGLFSRTTEQPPQQVKRTEPAWQNPVPGGGFKPPVGGGTQQPVSDPNWPDFSKDADPYRRIVWSLQNGKTVNTQRVGLDLHDEFKDVHPGGELLVGLETEHDKNGTIHGIRALTRNATGATTRGELHGKAMTTQTNQAKAGYAVGAILIWNQGFITQGIRIRFMRIKNDRLDPRDAYETAWIGNSSTGGTTLTCAGNPIIGIHGKVDANTKSLLSLGLTGLAERK